MASRHVRSSAAPGPNSNPRVSEVLTEADRRGLLHGEKTEPKGGRMSAALLAAAKERTGIEGTTQLITYALAKVALEDDFADRFLELEGTVPRGTLVAE